MAILNDLQLDGQAQNRCNAVCVASPLKFDPVLANFYFYFMITVHLLSILRDELEITARFVKFLYFYNHFADY